MYANGRFPLSMFEHLGGNIYLPPATAARVRGFIADVKADTGVTLRITGNIDGLGGWNGYRPFDAQVRYKAHYGPGAAEAGKSSHGGRYRGSDFFAVDFANSGDVPWPTFVRLAKKWGLMTDFVTPTERWHVGDPNPWSTPASGGGSAVTIPTLIGDEPMYIKALSDGAWARKGVIYTNDSQGHWRGMSNLEGSGYVLPLVSQGKLPFAEFNGTDLDLLFAMNGVWEQQTINSNTAPRWGAAPGTPLMGLGALTGRVMYPGQPDGWQYPIAQTPPDMKLTMEETE